MRTADPGEARARSALLSARFAIVMETVRGMLNQDRDFLTGKEIHALMRAELERELARAIAPSYDDDTHAPYMAKISRIVAAAYDIARRPERPTKLTEEDAQFLLAKGFDEIEFDFIEQDLSDRCYSDELADDDVRRRLEAVGAPANAVSIQRARPILMRARWEAHVRATRMDDPRVNQLLDDGLRPYLQHIECWSPREFAGVIKLHAPSQRARVRARKRLNAVGSPLFINVVAEKLIRLSGRNRCSSSRQWRPHRGQPIPSEGA